MTGYARDTIGEMCRDCVHAVRRPTRSVAWVTVCLVTGDGLCMI
jgi:hypothetical protein